MKNMLQLKTEKNQQKTFVLRVKTHLVSGWMRPECKQCLAERNNDPTRCKAPCRAHEM